MAKYRAMNAEAVETLVEWMEKIKVRILLGEIDATKAGEENLASHYRGYRDALNSVLGVIDMAHKEAEADERLQSILQ